MIAGEQKISLSGNNDGDVGASSAFDGVADLLTVLSASLAISKEL